MGWSAQNGWQGDAASAWSGLLGPTFWTPQALGSSLVGLFDARISSSIKAAGNAAITEGTAAATLASQVGGYTVGGPFFSNATGGPVYNAASLNGMPGLTFSGAQNLGVSRSISGAGFSFLFLGSTSSSTVGGRAIAFATYPATDYDNSAAIVPLYQNAAATIASIHSNAIITPSLAVTSGSPFAALMNYDGTTMSLRKDAGTASTVASTGAISAGEMVLGSGLYYVSSNNQNVNNFWRGVGGLWVVVNRVLTSSEIDKMFGWAEWAYGLQSNLPSGHPYKSRAPYVSDP